MRSGGDSVELFGPVKGDEENVWDGKDDYRIGHGWRSRGKTLWQGHVDCLADVVVVKRRRRLILQVGGR